MAAPASEQMDAIFYEGYGNPAKTFQFGKQPVPQPVGDQIQVKIHATGINPLDWKLAQGFLADFMPQTFPAIPCCDLSGVVTAVGPNATKFHVGDEVFGNNGTLHHNGALAQYTVASEKSLCLKPKSLSFEQAAGVAVTFLTAYQVLKNVAKVQAGTKVLILGGGGGVGNASIQIAKLLGAWVATTCSERNVDRLKALGADRVIDYKYQKVTDELKGADLDVVFDAVGSLGTWERIRSVMKSGAIHVDITGHQEESTPEHQFRSFMCNVSASEDLAELSALFDAGKLKVNVDTAFSPFTLQKALEMFSYAASEKATGRVVLQISH